MKKRRRLIDAISGRNKDVKEGVFDVEVDGKKEYVRGKKITKKRGKKTIVKFKAEGGPGSRIKKIRDRKVTKNSGEEVLKDKKITVFKDGKKIKSNPSKEELKKESPEFWGEMTSKGLTKYEKNK